MTTVADEREFGGTPGARPVAEVLAGDPAVRLLGRSLWRPWALALLLFVLVIGMIVFGPATEARFIYTDF